VLPDLGRPITAGIEEPVQHRHEHGPFHGKLKLPVLEQGLKNLRESQLTPDPLHDQRRPDLDRRGLWRLALLMRLEHRRVFGEAGEGGNQGVDLTGSLQDVTPSQRGQHLLPDASIDALVLHKLEILILAALLGSNKHGRPPCRHHESTRPPPIGKRKTGVILPTHEILWHYIFIAKATKRS